MKSPRIKPPPQVRITPSPLEGDVAAEFALRPGMLARFRRARGDGRPVDAGRTVPHEGPTLDRQWQGIPGAAARLRAVRR